jgi:predicted metallopeptidase
MILKNLNKIIAVLTIILVIVLIWKALQPEEHYSKVELVNTNFIVNDSQLPFIDTTLAVGLNLAGVNFTSVVVKDLTGEIQSKFRQDNVGVELYAAIIGNRSQFILYIRDVSRRESIKIIAHEIIHLLQYKSGRLSVMPPDKIFWQGDTLTNDDLYNMTYVDRPWEREAFDGEDGLADKMEEILYGKNM